MVRVDRSKRSAFKSYPEGQYLIQVAAAEIKRSKAEGTPYFNLRLVSAQDEGNPTVCFDRLMLEGDGLNITNAKLDSLGFSDSDADLNPEDLVGRRAWVSIKDREWNGEMRPEVNIRAKGFKCGYRPESDPPSSPIVDLSQGSAATRAAGSAADDPDCPF